MEKIFINTTYITLGQLIKLTNIFESGGFIKTYLKDHGVIVNGESEHRRGRKLYPKDVVQINEYGTFIVEKEQ